MSLLNDAGENAREMAKRCKQIGCIALLGDESGTKQETQEIRLDLLLSLYQMTKLLRSQSRSLTNSHKVSTLCLSIASFLKTFCVERVLERISELQHSLGLAKEAYRQLGGTLEEDETREKEEQQKNEYAPTKPTNRLLYRLYTAQSRAGIERTIRIRERASREARVSSRRTQSGARVPASAATGHVSFERAERSNGTKPRVD